MTFFSWNQLAAFSVNREQFPLILDSSWVFRLPAKLSLTHNPAHSPLGGSQSHWVQRHVCRGTRLISAIPWQFISCFPQDIWRPPTVNAKTLKKWQFVVWSVAPFYNTRRCYSQCSLCWPPLGLKTCSLVALSYRSQLWFLIWKSLFISNIYSKSVKRLNTLLCTKAYSKFENFYRILKHKLCCICCQVWYTVLKLKIRINCTDLTRRRGTGVIHDSCNTLNSCDKNQARMM